MSVRVLTAMAATLGVATSAGCNYVTMKDTVVLPGSRLDEMKSFYVVHRPDDGEHLEKEIAGQLEAIGLSAESGPELLDMSAYDGVVTYIEQWDWDVTTYCLQLILYIEDTRTGFITASGASRQPSLLRESPAGHARILLLELMEGVE